MGALWAVAIAALLAIDVWIARPADQLARDVAAMARDNLDLVPRLPPRHALDRLVAAVELLRARTRAAESATEATRIEATRRLDAEKRRLETILLDLDDGVIVCDLTHHVVLYNPSAAEAVGRTQALGLHRPLTGCLAAADIDSRLERLLALPAAERRRRIERFACTTDDGRVTLDTRLSLLLEADDSAVGYVLAFDATERTSDASTPPPLRSTGPRPEYYDFGRLERPPPPPDLAARSLTDLAYVVFDVEATGLEPSKGDEVVALGAVRVVNGRVLTTETFDRLVNPGRPIPSVSTRIHGITDAMVADRPPLTAVMPEFLRFAEGTVLVAHNAAFDMAFVERTAAAVGARLDHPVLDTLLLAHFLDGADESPALDEIARRLGLPSEHRHDALGDAILTARVLVRQIDRLTARGLVDLGDVLRETRMIARLRANRQRF